VVLPALVTVRAPVAGPPFVPGPVGTRLGFSTRSADPVLPAASRSRSLVNDIPFAAVQGAGTEIGSPSDSVVAGHASGSRMRGRAGVAGDAFPMFNTVVVLAVALASWMKTHAVSVYPLTSRSYHA
jgi:hypothetical protein